MILGAAILSLLLAGRPQAVAWLVVSVVVYALNCHAVRSRPHISKECLKAFAPFLAYLNATAAIVIEVLVAWVVAPLLHVVPNVVLRWLLSASGISVGLSGLHARGIESFLFVAPAALRSPVAEQASPSGLFIPAITAASPHGMRAAARLDMVSNALKNDKTPEAFTTEINDFTHREILP